MGARPRPGHTRQSLSVSNVGAVRTGGLSSRSASGPSAARLATSSRTVPVGAGAGTKLEGRKELEAKIGSLEETIAQLKGQLEHPPSSAEGEDGMKALQRELADKAVELEAGKERVEGVEQKVGELKATLDTVREENGKEVERLQEEL